MSNQVVESIDLCEEDIMNLKHCLERTKEMWEYPVDLWVYTVQHIIKEWEKNEQ